MDIASLGFKIDTSDVAKAETALDSLAASGAKTETSARGVGEAWTGVGRKVSSAAAPISATASAFKQGSDAMKAQQAELSKLLGQINPVVAALGRLDEQQQELNKHKLSGALDAGTFQDYSAKIAQARASLAGIDNTIRKTGVSSAQTANALRQLPAQFTDIFTSLAGGQNPLLVLIQQGGQIKDSFGGIGETFKALGGQVKSLFSATSGIDTQGVSAFAEGLAAIAEKQAEAADGAQEAASGFVDLADGANVAADAANNAASAAGSAGSAIKSAGISTAATVAIFVAAAAASAALAFAYKKGSDEASAYGRALTLTGNAAGTTTEELSGMANRISEVTGTTGEAAAALAELAGTGKIAASSFEQIAIAAISMEEATGKAASETIAEFVKIAKDPVSAARELSEQYNVLEASVYSQIVALKEQGDEIGAVNLLTTTYADTVRGRAGEITENLGLIESAWLGIKDAAAGALDATLDIGRQASADALLQKTREQLEFLQNNPSMQVSIPGERGVVEGPEGAQYLQDRIVFLGDEIAAKKEIALLDADAAKVNTSGISAQDRLNAALDRSASNAEKLKKRFAEIDRQVSAAARSGVNYSEAQIAQLRAAAEKDFADPKVRTKKAPAVRDDEATRLLLTLQGQEKSLQEQLASELKLTAEQKKRAEFEQLIADLKTKDILTADQKSLLANQDAIKTQLDKNVALAEEVRLHTDSIKLQERSAQIQASIETSADGRRQQQQRNLDAFGQGRAQQEQAEAAANIFREFRRYQDQLNKNTPKDLLGSEQYQTEREKIGQGLRDALSEHEAYYQRLDELQGSWQVGASQAFADFAEQSQDIAGQTANIIGSTLEAVSSGISESLTDALLHGEDLRESMADLGDEIFSSVVESLIQMGAQYAINSALEIAGLTAVSAAKVGAKSIETTAELTSIGATTSAEVGKAGAVATAKIGAITATKTAASIATAATTTEQVAAAGTTASSWSFAAIAASIGSFGTAAAIGLAAVVAAMAMGGGFRKGGYTGDGGVGDVAGVVHGQEFVFDAASTSRIGRGRLEAMQAGRDIAIGSTQQAAANDGGSNRAPTIITNHNSFPGVTDSREAKRATAQQSRQMARAMQSVGRYS